ncbi:MAG: radical SAM protein [Myxococcales bacterium]|nr:radical SAM protein [Myxococcales bacterium]
MRYALTHSGHKYALSRVNRLKVLPQAVPLVDSMMLYTHANTILESHETPFIREMCDKGWMRQLPEEMTQEQVALQYRRNPLENVHTINFEFTTHCNLHCMHCRSGIVKRLTETNVDALKASADLFLEMGISRFTFVGGEVSRYAKGWLSLVRHLQERYQALRESSPHWRWRELKIILLTSGWWLEKTDFQAAGETYASTEDYLTALKEAGLTHLMFSIDGPEERHDTWRKVPGLYQRILRALPKVKAAGLHPRISVVVKGNTPEDLSYLGDFADRIYDFAKKDTTHEKVRTILLDPDNFSSNLVDINNAVQLSESHFHLSQLPTESLRCKAFFRPSPKLSVAASGEISICPLMNAAEKYGNLHQKPLIDILNNLDDNFIFKLHAEDQIGQYLPLMDPKLFGEHFDHLCSLRTILNLIARKMHDRGIDPQQLSPTDHEVLKQINLDVARLTGHMP